MKRRVGTTLGFALFMVIGAIATLLIFSIFSAKPANADLAAATVVVTPTQARSIAQYTIFVSGTSGTSAIPVGGSFTVTFNTKTTVPSSIAASAIKLKATVVGGNGNPNQLVSPSSVVVSGRAITMTVPDMDPGTTGGSIGDNGIGAGASFTVIITQAAGIQNPNKASTTVRLTVKTSSDPAAITSFAYQITSFVHFTPSSASRGVTITVTGGGFTANCTTCHIRFSPQNNVAPTTASVGTGSIDSNGVFSGSFAVTSSTPAFGYVWVTDSAGISQVSTTLFVKRASAVPRSSTTMPGSTVSVDLFDFTAFAALVIWDGFSDATVATNSSVTIGSVGAVSFNVTVVPASGSTATLTPYKFRAPSNLTTGTHKVTIRESGAGTKTASFNIEVVPRVLIVTPNPAAIGQQITISGTGFDKSNGIIAISDLTAKAGSGTPVAVNTAVIIIDSTGAFAFTATVPTVETFASSTSDAITITATDNNGVAGSSTSSGFSRTKRTLTLTPATASPGTSVTVSVTGMTVDNNEAGVAATAVFTITSSPALTFPGSTTFPVGSDGSGVGTITIPSNASLGTVTLTATDNAAALNANATANRIAEANLTIGVPPEIVVAPVGPLQVGGGATVKYEIQAANVTDLAVARATFNFNSTHFQLESIPPGPVLSECLNATNDNGQGVILMALVCSDGHTGAPLTLWVVTLTAVEVQQNQATEVAITEPTLGNLAEQEIPARGAAQSVVIMPIVCGDVHPAGGGDGDDDVLDALRKLKIAVGLVTPTARELIAGDVHPDNESGPDGDGDIDVLDALRDLKASIGLVTITSCGGSA